MKHIKNFRLFEAYDAEDNFIIDAETEQSEFESHLESQLDARYDYGSRDTFMDIVTYIVSNSLIALGKTDDEAYEISSKLEGFFDYDENIIRDEYADYGHNVAGKNTYKGRVVCEYEAGGDGYAFSATVEDVSELFEDIREMLGFVVNEAALFDVKKDLKALEREREALVKKLKELPSPGAYASKAKSDLDAVEKKIKDLKKEKTKMLVPKK